MPFNIVSGWTKTIFYTLVFCVLFLGCSGGAPGPGPRVKRGKQDHVTTVKKNQTIALVFFHNADPSLQELLAREIKAFYKCKVEIQKPVALPQTAFYAPRKRYKADRLIAYLKTIKAGNYDKLVGFTNQDISTSKGNLPDWGIFGLAYRPGPSCIISSYRLKRNTKTTAVISQRVIKVTLHELGHTFGVPHCTFKDDRCLMNDAEGTLTAVDKEDKYMCKGCRALL